MEGLYEGFLILAGFVHLILIFLFVELVSHVRWIRKAQTSRDHNYLWEQYQKSMYLGRTEKALYYLQEYVWVLINSKKKRGFYESLKNKHEAQFLELGGKFPIYPF